MGTVSTATGIDRRLRSVLGGGLGGLGALLQRAHGTPAGACSGLHAPALGSGGRHCGPSPGAKRRAARLSAARSSACDACRPVLLPLGSGSRAPTWKEVRTYLSNLPGLEFLRLPAKHLLHQQPRNPAAQPLLPIDNSPRLRNAAPASLARPIRPHFTETSTVMNTQ